MTAIALLSRSVNCALRRHKITGRVGGLLAGLAGVLLQNYEIVAPGADPMPQCAGAEHHSMLLSSRNFASCRR